MLCLESDVCEAAVRQFGTGHIIKAVRKEPRKAACGIRCVCWVRRAACSPAASDPVKAKAP